MRKCRVLCSARGCTKALILENPRWQYSEARWPQTLEDMSSILASSRVASLANSSLLHFAPKSFLRIDPVGSAENNREETNCKSRWRGTVHAPSDDA